MTIYVYDVGDDSNNVANALRDIFQKISFINIDMLSNKPTALNSPYAIYVAYEQLNQYEYFHGDSTKFGLPMAPAVWEDSGNGLVNWIVSWSTEGHVLANIKYNKLVGGLNVRTSNQILFITGSNVIDNVNGAIAAKQFVEHRSGVRVTTANTSVNLLPYNHNLWHDHFATITKLILSNKPSARQYKGTHSCRNSSVHSMLLIAGMNKHNMYDNTIHSESNQPCDEMPTVENTHPLYSIYEKYKNGLITLTEKETQHLPDHHNCDAFQGEGNLVFDNARHSYIHVVSDSMSVGTFGYIEENDEIVDVDAVFITEHNFYPFMLMQPFIVNGNYHTVQTLRNNGYRTFDRWIDHSYDNIKDTTTRFDIMFAELKRLYSLTDQQWNDMYYEMYDDLVHNFNHLLNQHRSRLSYISQYQSAIIKFLISSE